MRIIISILTCIPFFLTAQQTFNFRTDLGQLNAVMTSVYPTDSIYYVTGILTESNNNNYTSSFFARYNLDGSLDSLSILSSNSNLTFETWAPSLRYSTDGNFIISGYGYDSTSMFGLILKYNHWGDTLWTKIFPNPLGGDFIRPDDMIQLPNGNILVASTVSLPGSLPSDVSLFLTNETGDSLWQQTYGDNAFRDGAPFLHFDQDSSVILSWGISNNHLANPNPPLSLSRTIWIDSLGNVIHSIISDISNSAIIGQGRDIIKINNRYFIGSVFGTRSQTSNNIYANAYLYSLDSSRNLLWGKKIANHTPTNISDVRKIFPTNDGNLLAIGTRVINDSIYYMGYMQKVTPNGDSLWQRTYAALTTNSAWNEVYDAHPTLDGGYLICGESLSFFPSTEPLQQAWLLKVDSMGCLVPGCHITSIEEVEGQELLQIKTYPNPATDYLNVYVPPIRSSSDLQLHLYNLEGKLVQNHSLPQSDATYMMQVDDLAAGTYVLQLLGGDGSLLGSGKVVIQN